MKRLLICTWALAALVATATADDEKKKDKPATPAEQYQALVKEYQQAQQDFFNVYRKAKTDAERQEAMKNYPQPARYAGRFLQLAEEHADDPIAVEALAWVVTYGRGSKEADTALKTIQEKHVDNANIARICQSLIYNRSPQAENFLRAVLEKNPHDEAKGWAAYSLAKSLANSGKQDESEKMFERVVNDFGNVKSYRGTLADLASGDLFEIRNLAIGRVAPDIQGEDIDGVDFKLSDYRGKVVVLDFWGNW